MRLTRSATVVAMGCLLLVTGCGSRLTRQEILAQNAVDAAPGREGAAPEMLGGAGPSAGTATRGQTRSTGGSLGAGTRTTTGSGSGTGDQPTVGGTGGSTTGAAGSKQPLTIGLIGYFSGIGGPVHIPKRDAFLVWAKMVNARGGINGHPVQVLWADDGGDEAQAASLARDLVENKGALALSVTGSVENSVVSYATQKHVPVIGISGGPSDEARKSPMMFRASAGGKASTWGSVALAKAAGVTKVAVFYCAESVECQAIADDYAAEARHQGLQVVYSGKNSVTQPDYTADCLQAKNLGAQLIFPITDNTAPVRMAKSCARQGLRPIWELQSAADAQAGVPELAGAINASDAFPWFLRSGPPGLAEYVRAFQQFLPSRLTDGTRDQASAWLTVKIFESAARIATRSSGKVTPARILDGLWSMKNDTLGGLAPGPTARTFTKGKLSPDTYCVFSAKIEGGKWVAPRGLDPLCR